jgi:SAM-dependent methyltransferase
LPTIELARQGRADVVAIDPDRSALERLRQRVLHEELDHRVHPVCSRFPVPAIDAASFDLIWEEGVFHLLDPARSLDECARLLRPGGWLVMLETDGWIDDNLPILDDRGWALKERLPLPRGCWWERYYEPLAVRVARLRELGAVSKSDSAFVEGIEREIAAVRRQPSAFDCSFAISRRR